MESWNGKYSVMLQLRTTTHPVFTALRRRWYAEPDSKGSPKIVPSDLRLTWRTVAIWMCDDGSNTPSLRTMKLHTNGFSFTEVEFLADRIQKDLGVLARVNRVRRNALEEHQPIISINGDEWFRFIEGIKPFVPWECLQYKCLNRRSLRKGYKFKKGRNVLEAALARRGWSLVSDYAWRQKMQVRCEHGEVFSRFRHSLVKPNCTCDCQWSGMPSIAGRGVFRRSAEQVAV